MAHKHVSDLALSSFPSEKRLVVKHPFNLPVYDEYWGYIEVEPRKFYRIGTAEDVKESTAEERGEMFYVQLMTDCWSSIKSGKDMALH